MLPYVNYKPAPNEDATIEHRGLMTAKHVQALNLQGTALPKAHVFQTVSATLSHATVTAITHSTARYNQAGRFGATLPWVVGTPTRITVPAGEGGLWVFGGQLFAPSSAGGAGDRWVALRHSGGTIYGRQSFTVSQQNFRTTVSTIPCAAGEYVELVSYQDTGGAVAGYSNGEFWGYKLA